MIIGPDQVFAFKNLIIIFSSSIFNHKVSLILALIFFQAHLRLKITKEHTIKPKEEGDLGELILPKKCLPKSLFCSVHVQVRCILLFFFIYLFIHEVLKRKQVVQTGHLFQNITRHYDPLKTKVIVIGSVHCNPVNSETRELLVMVK